ncbi:MAG: HAD family hydrolase [Kutzneria sp.]|nr:HAD family hydrolase [Kutzneria sp.]MBV9845790.1 HAD family hydrolase [Kutzneria sp.]
MRTLIVFDIDGTLLRSVAQHQAAFLAALHDTGLSDIDTAWGGYTHHTDSWIFREVFRANTGRVPSAAETQRFADVLHDRFRAATEAAGVAEIPGAAEFLCALAKADDYDVAFATGGMREVTAVKLAPFGALGPVATASDHTFREHVVREAIHQSGTGFDRVVSIGDGPWDMRAAVATGSQFIGIGPSTAPFGDWFPETHLFSSFGDVDPGADFSLCPPEGAVAAEPHADKAFAARPAACVCWE